MLTIKTTGLDDYLDGGTGRIKVLIMGPPGSGKTRSASFWPKPLLADCEEGRMSVADRAIPYAAIKTTADMKALLDLAEAEGKRPKDQRRFETLIIDTLDAYQRLVIQEYLASVKKASMSGWQDWGHLDAEMTELVARLSGIPMNVVVNLHIKDTKVGGSDDGDGGILVKSPKLKGDLKDQIAAEFDLVGFMETGWEAVDGKRALARYVQWEPSPDKPILKDRSGQLPKKTPVAFTTEDYEGLLRPLQDAQDTLVAGSVVAEIETATEPEPVTAAKGGPVTSVADPATPKKAAKKDKVEPKPEPKPVSTAPVPAAQSAPKSVPEPTEADAVAVVADVLGGTVIEPSVADQAAEAGVTTHVVESGPPVADQAGVPTPVVEQATSSIPAPAADTPGTGTVTVACGQPRYAGGTVPSDVEACGQELVLDMQEGIIAGCESPADQNHDLIQIGGLKSRTFLCNACFIAYRKAHQKTSVKA